MTKIYGLKNCDTCRKAVKALPDAVLVDVRAEGMPTGLLSRAYEQFGQALLNTRSTTWRALSEAERAGAPLDLIGAHPALMKRPLIVAGDQMFLGWNATTEAGVRAAG